MNFKMEVTNFKMEVTKLPGISNNRGEYEMAIVIQKNENVKWKDVFFLTELTRSHNNS